MVWRSGLGVAGIVAATLTAAPALANDPDPAIEADVMTRARPEYDARGLRLGAFFLYPSLTVGAEYNDNVFNDASDIDDTILTAAPQMNLRSNWSRHALNLSAEAKTYAYQDQSSEDRTDFRGAADLRLDFSRGTDLTADAHYTSYHEPRGTDLTGGFLPGDPAEPTALTRSGAGLTFRTTLNRLQLSAGGDLEAIDYDDTPVIGGGPEINNDDRDRTVTEAFAKAEYEAMPGAGLFVRGKWNAHDFDAVTDDDGYNRDSDGWGFDGGVEFAMTHVLVGELFAGYDHRSYDDPAFDATSSMAFGAGLKWFPSMLTTISIDGARSIEDTSITAASGYVSTRGQIGLDHELLRNLIFSSRVGFENAEYQDITREDQILQAKIGGRFLINNYFHFDAGWQYVDRDSDATAFDYRTNSFEISLTGKL